MEAKDSNSCHIYKEINMANIIILKETGKNDVVFNEQTEFAVNGKATRYSNRAVVATSPETVQITQDGSNIPGSRRTSTIYWRKTVPYVNEVGANAVENINFTFKLSQIPTRLDANKPAIIKEQLVRVAAFLLDDTVIDALLNGENQLNQNIDIVRKPTE